AISGSRSPKSATTTSWRVTRRVDCQRATASTSKNPGAIRGFFYAVIVRLVRNCCPLLFGPAEIQRWQFDLRYLNLDLAEIDVDRFVEQAGDHDRESDH